MRGLWGAIRALLAKSRKSDSTGSDGEDHKPGLCSVPGTGWSKDSQTYVHGWAPEYTRQVTDMHADSGKSGITNCLK